MTAQFDIFLAIAPGLEDMLCAELREAGFGDPRAEPGGVTVRGGWPEVWRANLEVRGANRVLARIASFRVVHLAQLDKRARQIPWGEVLRADRPVRVEATCRKSRIYHAGAAAQRIETAIREELGAPLSPGAELCVRVRIDDNICTVSVDTSGELLHRRGFKEAVNRAPMRETLAALFLRQCGYDGSEPVLDPMCGSGTLVIEAAEIAAGLVPGRGRSFAFEQLAGFDSEAWHAMRAGAEARETALRFRGSDRDAGAVAMSRTNAHRAGVAHLTQFSQVPVEDLQRPDGPPGLVIVNPPYGARIGNKTRLQALYRSLGTTLLTRFSGWRVGLVTTEKMLAKATRLPFGPAGPVVDHGGLKIRLYTTGPLA
ncbi:class I SAM-dependent RNA methyltransferase [Maricaulis sp.]|uniref:THUMP domain-containing class I SAM-dependent RNA methyltransferase n=1 Tax=Maricaulis sp. TaxID=1486257 RepID=UPI0026259C80|nr:class I SAM-dependent RNA methyltransferase [Maricaulis sp.]